MVFVYSTVFNWEQRGGGGGGGGGPPPSSLRLIRVPKDEIQLTF